MTVSFAVIFGSAVFGNEIQRLSGGIKIFVKALDGEAEIAKESRHFDSGQAEDFRADSN